eukprot:4503941-Alexandrium_andersonii.AAC.1
MRDLGAHVNLARRAVGTTLSTRMCKATKVAVSAGAFPIGPAMRLAVVKTKVLPLGVYGAESTPVA